MKIFQFDGATYEFTDMLDVSRMDATSLADLTLQQRLDAIEGRVAVEVDQWTTPATDRTYLETPNGTWIMKGSYGRMEFAIAANPHSDLLAGAELRTFCYENKLTDEEKEVES